MTWMGPGGELGDRLRRLKAAREETRAHTFVAHLEDRPGALARVVSLFRRRGYNILSLNVGRTHEPGWSRLTVVVEADDDTAARMAAQLRKLVDVDRLEDLTGAPTVVRDLALVKVTAAKHDRAQVLQLAEVFRARVVDVGEESLTLEVSGDQDKIDGLVAVLRPFGIEEMVQTGTVAMRRGPGAS